MATDKSNEERGLNRANKTRETDLANQKTGRNSLQGDDQMSVRNQRHAQPDTRREADEVMESFEKMDKEKRARTDLGKGNRSGR
ncbi:hypothetical protein [Chelativorans sp. YIM 93263]|uniref:hypothetical protein n=1 Tax=Chelativorans sp. YIM 93263 TaxID=2906648 RepID=UPI0023784E47|nr:hypothetical protein [Chelativorans sp. YIM 93263]